MCPDNGSPESGINELFTIITSTKKKPLYSDVKKLVHDYCANKNIRKIQELLYCKIDSTVDWTLLSIRDYNRKGDILDIVTDIINLLSNPNNNIVYQAVLCLYQFSYGYTIDLSKAVENLAPILMKSKNKFSLLNKEIAFILEKAASSGIDISNSLDYLFGLFKSKRDSDEEDKIFFADAIYSSARNGADISKYIPYFEKNPCNNGVKPLIFYYLKTENWKKILDYILKDYLPLYNKTFAVLKDVQKDGLDISPLLKAMSKFLSSSDEGILKQVAERIRSMSCQVDISFFLRPLVPLLHSRDRDVRWSVIQALSEMAKNKTDIEIALELLLKKLNDTDFTVCTSAVVPIIYYHYYKHQYKQIIELLKKHGSTIQIEIMYTIENLAFADENIDMFIPGLLHYLDDEDMFVQIAACSIFKTIAEKKKYNLLCAIAPIINLCLHKDFQLSERAIETIEKLIEKKRYLKKISFELEKIPESDLKFRIKDLKRMLSDM